MKFKPQILLLLSICCFALSMTACAGFMSLWTIGNVALGAVGIALAALGSVLSPAQVSAITGAVSKVQSLWNDLKTAVQDYTTNATNGTLTAVQGVIADIQAALPDVETAANIGNPVVKAVIAAVLAASGDVLSYLAKNVLPQAAAAKAQFTAHNAEPAKALDVGMKLQAVKTKTTFEAAIANSGLDADTIKKINDHCEHETHAHLGPFRV